MTKRFITEQNNNSNPEVSYQAKKTKKTHLGALRAVCSNYLRATDVDLSIHMKVFEYSSEERSNKIYRIFQTFFMESIFIDQLISPLHFMI